MVWKYTAPDEKHPPSFVPQSFEYYIQAGDVFLPSIFELANAQGVSISVVSVRDSTSVNQLQPLAVPFMYIVGKKFRCGRGSSQRREYGMAIANASVQRC